MYTFFLTLHNLTRWLVVIFAVLALVRMYSGMIGRKAWTAADNRAGMLFTMFLDIQVLLGLILYFFSPTTLSFLGGQAGMANALVRFFAVEHTLLMLVAVVIAHVGRSLSKKASSDAGKFRRGALWFTIAVLLILFAIPWPFMPVARPWLRFGNFGF
jgi:hypothetical protein